VPEGAREVPAERDFPGTVRPLARPHPRRRSLHRARLELLPRRAPRRSRPAPAGRDGHRGIDGVPDQEPQVRGVRRAERRHPGAAHVAPPCIAVKAPARRRGRRTAADLVTGLSGRRGASSSAPDRRPGLHPRSRGGTSRDSARARARPRDGDARASAPGRARSAGRGTPPYRR
jgi:hypothetical protein